MRGEVALEYTTFTPSFTDQQLDELRVRVQRARTELPAPTYASRQARYGITHEWMEKALDYWGSDYDWKRREAVINEVDHFKAEVEGHTVHFIAHFSEDPEAIPLLLNHGWPGSAFEFIEVIKILRKSSTPSFHLVAPMQLGFGFSSNPPLDRGFGLDDMASILDSLMVGLGFEGYASQGGDIGSILTRILSVKYDSVKAANVNYLPLAPSSSAEHPFEGLTEREITNAKKAATFASEGRGYAVMHATRPSTIGIVVQSSPTALLAWLAEKMFAWYDSAAPPTMDHILDTVTMWWILGSFPNAIWAYSDIPSGVGGLSRDPSLYISKPFGFSSFAEEIASAPESWAAETGNLAFYSYHERGGHFAAEEQPAAFAADMQKCFSKIWPRE